MKDYFDHVANLTEPLAKINEECYDITGRPTVPLRVTIGKLCEISNDWDSFVDNYTKFFYNLTGLEGYLELGWHCYIKGMVVLSNKLENRYA